jgi:DNA end-binding protein Ku
MPRAVWTGSVSFGLVTIPARLYPATEPKDVRFHLTDDRGRRIRYRRFVADDEPAPAAAPADNDPSRDEETSAQRSDEDGTRVPPSPGAAEEKEIAFHDLLRGYETDDGRLVVLGRDEIEAARPEPSRTIEIEDFVDLVDIDPVYFDKSYVLAPQGGAEKPYVLLLRAMEQAGRIGIGRFVLRTKPHLVAIRPAGGVLGLETMFFGDEVRDARTLVGGLDAIAVSDRELGTARLLIDTLKVGWDPSSYADTYREELLRRIQRKGAIEPVGGPVAGRGPRIDALMQALQESVEAAKRRPGSRKRLA